jgi:hypothetical protein
MLDASWRFAEGSNMKTAALSPAFPASWRQHLRRWHSQAAASPAGRTTALQTAATTPSTSAPIAVSPGTWRFSAVSRRRRGFRGGRPENPLSPAARAAMPGTLAPQRIPKLQPRKPCYVLDAIDPRLKEVIVGRCGHMASSCGKESSLRASPSPSSVAHSLREWAVAADPPHQWWSMS